jgi:hypothetical protein
MRKTKGSPDLESKKQYEELLEEVLKEKGKQISQRNQEYFDETLKLFVQARRSQIEHSNWRDADMLPTMFEILATKYRQLNPWKYEQICYEDYPEFDPEPRIVQTEIYPGLDRRALEILAADQHLMYNNKTETKAEAKGPKESKSSKKEKKTPVEKRKGNLPEISLKDLLKTGLSVKEIVDDWIERNPEEVSKMKEVYKADIARDLSQATSRTKKNLEKQGPVALPMRCHKSKDGRWHEYALTYAGKPGEGNKYGIIKASLSTDQA